MVSISYVVDNGRVLLLGKSLKLGLIRSLWALLCHTTSDKCVELAAERALVSRGDRGKRQGLLARKICGR
jgi:hypothetical protein